MRVEIKNYQAIKKATIQIDKGLTAIIGPTNSGKSSIIRAIKGAINNQSGNGFINYDADDSTVTITEKDNNIKWVKSRKGSAKYIINGEEVNKIGRSQNEEVAELLNMTEIDVGGTNFRLNFWEQMEKAFLMDKSPNQLFNFISQSREQDLVSNLNEDKKVEHTNLTSQVKTKYTTIDILNQDIEKIKDNIKTLKPIQNFDLEAFKTAININTQLTNLESLNDELSSKLVQSLRDIKSVETNIKNLTATKTKLEAKLLEIDNTTNKLNQIKTLFNQLETTLNSINNTKNSLKISQNKIESTTEIVGKLENALTKINNTTTTYKDIKALLNQHSDINQKRENAKQSIINNDNKIKELEIELSLIDVCPYCEQDIDHTH